MDLLQVCGVCSSRLFPRTRVGRGTDAFALTPCGHVFHRECAEHRIRRNPTCPTCHANVLNGRRVYLPEDVKPAADYYSNRRKEARDERREQQCEEEVPWYRKHTRQLLAGGAIIGALAVGLMATASRRKRGDEQDMTPEQHQQQLKLSSLGKTVLKQGISEKQGKQGGEKVTGDGTQAASSSRSNPTNVAHNSNRGAVKGAALAAAGGGGRVPVSPSGNSKGGFGTVYASGNSGARSGGTLPVKGTGVGSGSATGANKIGVVSSVSASSKHANSGSGKNGRTVGKGYGGARYGEKTPGSSKDGFSTSYNTSSKSGSNSGYNSSSKSGSSGGRAAGSTGGNKTRK